MKRALLAVFVVALALPVASAGEPAPARVMRVDRLLALAERIEGQKTIRMSHWRPDLDDPNGDYCAGGHATKLFAAEEFHWPRDGRRTVVYRGKEGEDACALFFGLDHDTAKWLFSPSAGDDPKQVAASIRAVVKHGQNGLYGVLVSAR